MANPVLADLARDARLLKTHFPQGRSTLRAGKVTWVGSLQPTAISDTYLVCVRYNGRSRPKVTVQSPALEPNDDGELPHIYADGTLCLYRDHQWSVGDALALTIIPWTCEWLAHYELWQITDTWHGSGGDHTGPVREKSTHAAGGPRRTRRRR